MNSKLKEDFLNRWGRYFPKADQPIAFQYKDEEPDVEPARPASGWNCFIGQLKQVREGKSLYFTESSVGCGGGKRYLGFTEGLRPNFEYFLSCGIPGKMEGERYKKNPELVKEVMKHQVNIKAPARYLVAKRWDGLQEADDPEVVAFFATADILSGLFTLANFDEPEPNAVFTPFCAGCGSIINYPYIELKSGRPRAVLGMFDVSARPFVEPGILSFAVPMPKFERMISDMDESFLITESWKKVEARIKKET